MTAMEPFCQFVGVNPNKVGKEEYILLEAGIFSHICHELKEFFRVEYKVYFRTMKYTTAMENAMLDLNFLILIIKDILLTKEYTLEGIATYTDTHVDVIQELVYGRNTNPSAILQRRIIDLHRSVRCDLYNAIFSKIAKEHLSGE